jgi:hypothetical protein
MGAHFLILSITSFNDTNAPSTFENNLGVWVYLRRRRFVSAKPRIRSGGLEEEEARSDPMRVACHPGKFIVGLTAKY